MIKALLMAGCRPDPRLHRHGYHHRQIPVHVRTSGPAGWGGLVPVVMGLFGISEVLENLETRSRREIFDTKIQESFPQPEGLERLHRAHRPGNDPRLLPGNPSRRRSHHRLICFLRHGKEGFPRHPEEFGTAPSRGGRPGSGKQLRRQREPSSPSSPWGFPPMPSWPYCWAR